MSFPRYPEYKDSGVEWLGEVPGHWKAVPLKTVSTHNDDVLDESTTPDAEIAYVDISSVDGINGIKMKEDMLFSAAPSRARRRVKHGDVIVSTVRTYLKAIARIRDPEENLVVSTGFAVIRPRGELAPDFLGHLVSAGFFVDQVIARSTGVSYPAINASELVAIPVPVPPLPEQTQIAAFLDRETAKIDALVAEQRRLMALLKEKRQAVISHAVTRGLNPDAPMKPSGIEWLGDVPAHWTVLPLRRSIQFLTDYEANGSFADTKANVKIDDGEPHAWYVRATDLEQKRFGIVEGNRFCDEASYEWLRKTTLFGGELLVAKRGEIGKVYVMPDVECRATLAPNLYLIRLNAILTPSFAWYWFSVDPGRAELVLADKSTTIGALYKDDARSMLIVTPSIEEQAEIVKFLNAESAKFDTLTAEAQRAIDLLQERRTALISAAVTGQIEVRGVV
ncbi:restriction endonuclease subunit S [Rhodoferax sp.]|uniref:restriction endonuclease subunit S n=1 Tax=Rhodoferax sp. TaxID=50421 RepID=UPI0025FAE156|nr:restriction endonuclease subunit S [Rhodoferax sp.]MCM2342192.1 restriction endonuclease subunit S [Rhodoferax sp.]